MLLSGHFSKFIPILLLKFGCIARLMAELTLPSFFSDGMVLQRDQRISLWGWDSKADVVKVTINGQTYSSEVREGLWRCDIPSFETDSSFSISIEGSEKRLIQDVVLGDVFLASGQSNMELPLWRVTERYSTVINDSENPDIRFFRVPANYSFQGPLQQLTGGSWKKSNPNNSPHFSALAYFFAHEINRIHDVPVGIVDTSVGGSPIEAWMDEVSLEHYPEALEKLRHFQDPKVVDVQLLKNAKVYKEWDQAIASQDKGINGDTKWYETELDTSSWDSIRIPGPWKTTNLEAMTGVIWFRRTVYIPEETKWSDAKLYLGAIEDADTVFVNGVQVGRTTYQYPPRIYKIPESVLKHGENIIVIRAESHQGLGQFIKDKPYRLNVGSTIFPLEGKWKYKVGCNIPPRGDIVFPRWQPTGLYHAMLAPLRDLSIKGVLWYQGESNVSNPQGYAVKMETMLGLWRKQFNNSKLPFFYVQLANFLESSDEPIESNWAYLREEQRKAQRIPHTHMTVAIDLGEWNDIHPLNKKDIALRMVRGASNLIYNQKVVDTGPQVEKAEFIDGNVVISFKTSQVIPLAKCGGSINELSIAGADKQFIRAEGALVDSKLVIESKFFPIRPKWVRYGWANNPEKVNLYNSEGLPASPFELEID